MEASIARGNYLDRKARNAPYYKHKGRSMLDFTTNIEATPGEYSMEISLGTLPQKFVAIADTGSDLVWLECKACTVCMNASAVFDPSVPLFHLQPAGMQRVQCPRQQRGHLHAQLPVHVRIRRSIDDPGRFLPRHSHSAEHERHLHGHRQFPIQLRASEQRHISRRGRVSRAGARAHLVPVADRPLPQQR